MGSRTLELNKKHPQLGRENPPACKASRSFVRRAAVGIMLISLFSLEKIRLWGDLSTPSSV